MLYTGPLIQRHFHGKATYTTWQINSSFHYMITGTRNFIGMEVNKELDGQQLHTVLCPQMRLGIAHNLMIGIVTGIPVKRTNERISSFLRLIYEPGHRRG